VCTQSHTRAPHACVLHQRPELDCCCCVTPALPQRLCDWLNGSQKTCTAFDFPTKGILQEALKKNELWRLNDGNGKPPGLMGW
jgi:hypothetical protein